MKEFFLLVLVTLVSTIVLRAQKSQFNISGNVQDERKTPVPFANVAIYNLSDSTLVTGAISDGNGHFSVGASKGNYYVNITYLSYQSKTINNIVLSKDIDLGIVVMKQSSQLLDEITVQSERSQMELYLDKRVFNVGKDLSNISGSAADILDKVPSVTVDMEGNVNLRGSQNVRILIDGKPSGLTGINTATALRQLQGNLIESIEVITNPSSKFDAEGEVGIINIILKKNKKQGVNGAFTVNVGYPANYGGSLNLNMRKKNINLFSSYGISYRNSPGKGSSYQKFETADTTFAYEQQSTRERGGVSHNVIAGLDYFFNEKSILTGSFIYRRSQSLNKSTYAFRDLDENENLVRTILRKEREEEPGTDMEFALSYKKDFERKGHSLSADIKYILNDELESATFNQTDDSDNSTLIQRSTNKEFEENFLVQTDYIKPFNDKGKIEAGLKSTKRIIENAFLVEAQGDDLSWSTVGEFDNSLTYTENIHAGYLIVGNEINRFSYQAGVRGELTDIGVELRLGDNNYQNYFNIFPSTHLSYKLDDASTVQLSYSYRISRPGFRDLLPFSNYSNSRSLRTGNPALRPEYTHSMEGSYLYNWEKGSVLSSLYYRYRTGVIQRINVVDSIGFNRSFPINLATENAYGVEFNLSLTPTGWLNLNVNGNFYRAISEGRYEDEILGRDTYTWNSRGMARLTFLKNYNFQASINYRAPQNTTQGKTLSMYSVDLGLSRDLLKGNGTLTMSVQDLFNTRKFRNIVITKEFYSESSFQWRARQLLLTFTYRLNKKKEAPKKDAFNGDGDGDF